MKYKDKVLQFVFLFFVCWFLKTSLFIFVKKCYVWAKHESYNYYKCADSLWYPVKNKNTQLLFLPGNQTKNDLSNIYMVNKHEMEHSIRTLEHKSNTD